MYSDYKSKNNRNPDIDMTFTNVSPKKWQNNKMRPKVNGLLIVQHDLRQPSLFTRWRQHIPQCHALRMALCDMLTVSNYIAGQSLVVYADQYYAS